MTRQPELFTTPQLADGAELVLSGDLKANTILPKKLTLPGQRDEEITVWSGLTKAYESGKKVSYTSSLGWIPGLSLVAETRCDCPAFHRDSYACPHVAGLYVKQLMADQGEDCLRGTPVQEELRQRAQVEDPFQPGVLRRTDDRLAGLLNRSEDAHLPVWHTTERRGELLDIDIDLCHDSRGLQLQLKMGSGRHYQIQNLRDLLSAYIDRTAFTFGKKSMTVAPDTCTPFAEKVMNLLSGMLQLQTRTGRSALTFTGTGSGSCRYALLTGHQQDQLLELLDGHQVTLDGKVTAEVCLAHKGLTAVLRRKSAGATLSVSSPERLCASGSWIYLYDGGKLFRIAAETPAKQAALNSMLEWDGPLFIRENDIPAVCRQLLPMLREVAQLQTRGIDPEASGAQTPSFRFDLDYTDDEQLVCVPYALYPRSGGEYRLYDDAAGRGIRNARVEQEAAALCARSFDRLDRDTMTLTADMDQEGLYDFLRNELPEMEKLGTVRATDSVHSRAVRRLPHVSVGVSLSDGSLALSLKGSDMSPDELAELLSAYTRKKRFHRLKSGAFVSFEDHEEGTWDTLAELWQHSGSKDPEHMRLPLYRAMYLQEALQGRDDAHLESTAEYRGLLDAMGDTREEDSAIPASLRETLRPYQRQGFHWIRMLKRSGFGGILADDMGLGKTLQVLAFLQAEKEAGLTGDELRTLIVCPASLVYNWQHELERFTPGLSCCVIAGTAGAREKLITKDNPAQVWVTSYDLLKRDISRYDGIVFANQVIDEAQFIKNQSTQAAQSVRVVNSRFRMALTGTPIENHLSELWSIMDYLMPGFLYAYSRFLKEYETPIVSQQDTAAMDRLRRMVHPFILRRLKKQVLKELPDKVTEVVTVRLQGEQKKLYEAAAAHLRQQLERTSQEEYKQNKLMVLKELTQLRQLCCDPSLLYENYIDDSAKLEACLTLVRQAIDGGHKLLLFSQFTTMLDIIGSRLHGEGISFHRIDGSVSKEDRMTMVDSFANDEVPVFLISLKAGGTGLNLTAADIVIHYDPWWNQAAQNQATDRAHRIGQTQTVNVYELIAGGTIEERIQQLKESKAKLADDVLTGEGISSIMVDREDLLSLLD